MSCVKVFTVHADVFISSCHRFHVLFLLRNLHKKEPTKKNQRKCVARVCKHPIAVLVFFCFFFFRILPWWIATFSPPIGRNMFWMFFQPPYKQIQASGFCHLGTFSLPKTYPKHRSPQDVRFGCLGLLKFSFLAQESMLLLQPKAVCSSSTASIIRHSGLPTSAWTRCT